MRSLKKIEEFRREASNALFTKEQAIVVATKLFELELSQPDLGENDRNVLENALSRISLRYFDTTETETDAILDAAGVARLTVNDIADAMDVMLFEAQ